MHSQRALPLQLGTTAKTPNTSSGHSSQRQQRAEWQKPAPITQVKPISINRSNEKTSKRTSNGSKGNNQFLFNSSGQSSSTTNKQTEHQLLMMGKSKTFGSSNFSSQNNTLESQQSMSNLPMPVDSAMTLKAMDKTLEPTSNVLSELQLKLINFNNHKKASGRNQNELSSLIQTFQPMTKTQKYKKKSQQDQKQQASLKLNQKNLSAQSNKPTKEEPINTNKENDNSNSDSEVEEFNEEISMKKSSSQPRIFEQSSPKQYSLLSYQESSHSRAFVKAATGLDSRNQMYQVSQQSSLENSPSEFPKSPDTLNSQQIIEKALVNQIPVVSKTPSEVFQYKLKSANVDNFKSKCNILVDSNKTSKNNNSVGKVQVMTSKNTQLKPFVTSNTQEKVTVEERQSLPQLSQIEFDALNMPFFFSTQMAPPNTTTLTQFPSSAKPPQVGSKISYLESEMSADLRTNIKVVARFRPLNRLENEISQINKSTPSDIFEFSEDQRAVKIREDYCNHSTNNMTFTFDHVFQENVPQSVIFDKIGQQKIVDIMNGYNGTIFAYGQTGSGKTYTMYGNDIFDEYLMGIVPRAARQIFNSIRDQDLEVEYSIKVSMVEIYKETLRDLLHDTPEPAPELKIKEDPKRGTYIEGLNQVCIVSEEEIMTVLCTGETMRHVASTHLNQVSSRSHSICIIEVVQKYPNDSEKKGVLNLVDLAGSERVSKSHAKGQALEEAKKINFSLSMLGKVISSLTKNSQHVPYRDSKLTRLLKESLGGNNKTTLLVACSMHQSNLEETLSSLRFAQSAKFIQNKVKMNIKTSSEQLQVVINQLKSELRTAKEEIYRLRVLSVSNISHQNTTQKITLKEEEEFLFKTCDPTSLEQNFELAKDIKTNINNSDSKRRTQILHNRPHQSLLAKNYDVIETNNQKLLQLTPDVSIIPPSTGTPNFTSPAKNFEIRLAQLSRKNEELEMMLQSKDQDIEALKCQKEELCEKVNKLEEKLITYKQKLLTIEKQVAEFEIDKDLSKISEIKSDQKMEEYKSQVEILNQQVSCLQRALEDSDSNCQQLLKGKQSSVSKSFKEYMRETIKLNSISVSQALETYISDSQKPHAKMSFISHFDIENDFLQSLSQQQSKANSVEISLQDSELLKINLYSLELVNAVEEGSVPPEILIYLLKQLLIEASLANHNLQRVLSINRWRQVIEFGKNKIKSELCKIQENTIETLESILEKSRTTHDKLRERIEKLENHLYDNRNYYGDIIQLTDNQLLPLNHKDSNDGVASKIQRLNTVQGVFTTNLNQNQPPHLQNANSSLSIGNRSNNQKQRFIKTITNKTLGKGFHFGEKSPQSRQSMICGNMSIISQYYGQNKNTTPLRTSGMNSPQMNGFQSPVRRQGGHFANPRATFPHINIQIQPLTMPNRGNAATTMDHQNFEEALQKFIVTNEKEEKVTLISIQQDLEIIEQMTTVEEIKQYLKTKYPNQQEKLNLQPMFAQYQNACQSQQSSHLSTSQIMNSVTNNNNLYASSNNDYYADNIGPSTTQNNACDPNNVHQRQEHVLTLQSEYMLTSNSAIYPHGMGLFNNGQGFNHYYQNDYLDRLQEKIVQLQEEVETQKCRTEEHKKAYYESKRQIEQIREMMEDKESKLNKIMKQEIYQWENVVNKLKKMNEAELLKKQCEIKKLHELLAQWIDNYQELEVNKGVKQQCEVEKLLVETLRHRRNKSNSSGNLDFLTKRSPMLSTQTFSKTSHTGLQFETMRSHNNRNQSNHLNGTYEHYTLDSNSIDKTKYIKGDNSPIDSCLDLDQSQNQENSELMTHLD